MKTISYFLLCSILSFGCSKNSSNSQTPVTPKTEINMWAGDFGTGFGVVQKGAAKTENLYIQNLSTSNADLTGYVTVSGQYFSIASGSNFTLHPGSATFGVPITFNPLAVGTFGVAVTITHNATNMSSPIVVSSSGSGY